jgi:hypothetical protein
MSTATHTFHADVFGQDCEVGYHMADIGTDSEKIGVVIDHVTHSSSGDELLPLLNEDNLAGLEREAADNFRDSKDADVFGVESI